MNFKQTVAVRWGNCDTTATESYAKPRLRIIFTEQPEWKIEIQGSPLSS